MSNPEQIEQELRAYLEKEPNLRREERLKYLLAIFNKHMEFKVLEHSINAYDTIEIINFSKVVSANQKLPMNVTKRRMDNSETPHIALMEALISYLNRHHLLRKFVKFDYTE